MKKSDVAFILSSNDSPCKFEGGETCEICFSPCPNLSLADEEAGNDRIGD